MMNVSTLEGKVTLVTGGAGGLGEALCRTLSEAGATVLVADIREEPARKLALALNRDGSTVRPLVLDVCDENQIEKTMEEILANYGGLDILINNAGTDKTVSVEELSIQDWDRVMATNLRGPFLLSKYSMPMMKSQGHGHIINIVSTAAKRAWPNAAAYHASKWGLLGFSHALHTEARPHGVKVSAIIVGGMRTPFILDRFSGVDESTLQDPMNVAQTVRFVLTQPEETVIPEIMVIPMRETSWP
jgi:NAD(P)-dependent dehydrogenase (short-subunit alcohol dehydrogenase family)